MSMAKSVESAAETVALVTETVAEAAGAVDDVVESGRSLVRLLVFALIGLAVVAAVVKLVMGSRQTEAPAAPYEPVQPAASAEPEASGEAEGSGEAGESS